MSQRDQFAREAMSGILSCSIEPYKINPEAVAAKAYKIADAMLAERERTNKLKAVREMEE